MRDAKDKLDQAGIKVYAISYDDEEALNAYAVNENYPFPLLSDVHSEVIRKYGVLNEQIKEEDTFLYGIPYPGIFIIDEQGLIKTKLFHDSYKKRDSAETLIDAVRGKIEMDDSVPSVHGEAYDLGISVFVHGGNGSIRQGVRRKLVIRFHLGDGLHIYDEPVPEGMIPTKVKVAGPPGLVFEEMKSPPTSTLKLTSPDVELNVWSGTTDFVIPFYGVGELVSEVRPLDADSAQITVEVSYQACNEDTCLLPGTQSFALDLPLEVVDVPKLGIHMGHGQREGGYDMAPHMKRLMVRKVKKRPLNLLSFIWRNIKMQLAARKRLQ